MTMRGCGFAVLVSLSVLGKCAGLLTELSLSSKNKVNWNLENKNGTIDVIAEVPGGIYSDLLRNGIIDDIFKGNNDVMTRWVAHDSWTYSANFNIQPNHLAANAIRLVFHGVDTFSFIELNDVPIGSTSNMFVRYAFDIKHVLRAGQNAIKISFESPIEAANEASSKNFIAPACVPQIYNGECHVNQLRKMQASFAWDWGPAFPSVGLWKPVTIELYDGAIIRSVVTHTDKLDQGWLLRAKAYLETSKRFGSLEGYLSAALELNGHQTVKLGKYFETPITDGTAEYEINVTLSENMVSTWWPNGFGDQPLYDLDVYLSTNENTGEVSHKRLKIGFRTIEVVEEDASLKLGNTTAGKGLTFYFKVNGYALFMKGSNWIPAHILPEVGANKTVVNELLQAAQQAHMNMLRVWGGGIYEDDYFYRRCDELGILIWQDFLFACSMYPANAEFLESVKTEITQNVMRLQHHPSIAIWAGNNENEVALSGNWYDTVSHFKKYKEEYIKLYVDTIKPIVEHLDPRRRYLVSSPTNGRKSEQDGYISDNPYDAHYGDTHYYNYINDAWLTDNVPDTRFASEYGFQSFPSPATLKTATMNINDFSLHSDFIKHRQHSPNGNFNIWHQIQMHMHLLQEDPNFFKKFIFYSQINQAMAMKTQTEVYRQNQENWYTMGALYWQLNDVWQAPSWSGIEFGGKWKMLHFYAKSFFAPVLVSPRLAASGLVDVYLLNDRFVPIVDAQIIVDVFNWSSLIPVNSTAYPANAGPLRSKKQNIVFKTWELQEKKQFLRFSLRAEGVQSSPYNYVFPKHLSEIQGLKKPVINITVSKSRKCDKTQKYGYNVSIQSTTVVLFLWLEADEIPGRFEENGFIVTNPYTLTIFRSSTEIDPVALEKNIKYQYYIL